MEEQQPRMEKKMDEVPEFNHEEIINVKPKDYIEDAEVLRAGKQKLDTIIIKAEEIIDNAKEVLGFGKWNSSLVFDMGLRRSELCKAKDLKTEWYKKWCSEFHEDVRYHRKQWEWAYILQALWERDCIKERNKGLVFAVGTEPLPSILAKYGCEVLATDIFPEQGIAMGWTTDNQLCFGMESLNTRGICDEETFKLNVSYRAVDMNDIPVDIQDFDFNWSSCSFEHLGTIERGCIFLRNQLKTLKPGGWAIHTTEYNLSSNDITQDNHHDVIYRQRDIEKIVSQLREEGHFIEELDFSLGGLPEDYHVDIWPYRQDKHLRLQLSNFIVTSIGLIIQKKLD